MNIRQFCPKFEKKPNKIKGHSITYSHIRHFDISVLIRYTTSESLVEKQQFSHEWSSKMYENNAIKSKDVP